MKIILTIVTLLAALCIDWGIIRGTLFGIPFSCAVFAILFWFWHIRLRARLWWAAGIGTFLDTFSLSPFGTYTLSLFILAYLLDFLKMFFINVSSMRAQVISATALFAGFFVVKIPVSLIMEIVGKR